MRRYALLGLLLSCASRPPPTAPEPAPRAPTAREILGAIPTPSPERPLPLRPRPQLVLHTGPFLAWRPFWPLDRIDTNVLPYLTVNLQGRDAARYRDAWKRYEHGDGDRALAILSTLADKATDPTLRTAGHRDLIQLLAATYDPDIAARWLRDPDAFDVLAAEYARLGRNAQAEHLLSTAPLGDDERGCELHLNRARLSGTSNVMEVFVHARAKRLTGCLEGAAAYLCEYELARLTPGLSCRFLPNSDHAQRASLARVLHQWDDVPGRVAKWQHAADLWLDLADTALDGATVPGWENVVGDALFNALVMGDCDERTIGRVRTVAAAAPSPTGAELPRFANLTVDECKALTRP